MRLPILLSIAATILATSGAAHAFGRPPAHTETAYDDSTESKRISQALQIEQEAMQIAENNRAHDPLATLVFLDLMSGGGKDLLAADAFLQLTPPNPPGPPGGCADVRDGFQESQRLLPQINRLIQRIADLSRDPHPGDSTIRKLQEANDQLAALKQQALGAYPPIYDRLDYTVGYHWWIPANVAPNFPSDAQITGGNFEIKKVEMPSYYWEQGQGNPNTELIALQPRFTGDVAHPVVPFAGSDMDGLTVLHPISLSNACLGDVRIEIRGTAHLQLSGNLSLDQDVIFYGDK